MSIEAELIRRIDFFQPLDDRLVEKIARLCIHREYSPGDYIMRQGDPGLGLYFIARGSARVEIARDGVVTPVAELHAGEFVGELSIIDKQPRSANVVCTVDASCLLLTRDSFMKLLNRHPEIALQIAKTLAARLRSTNERMWQGAASAAQVPPDARTAPGPEPRSDKQKIKDMLADTVGWVYFLKSVTQFSLAVVGCPVEVKVETPASESRVIAVDWLKLALIPAGENHVIGVHAFADGAFTATILQPLVGPAFKGLSVSRFRAPIRRNQSVLLRFPAPAAAVRLPRAVSSGGGMRELEAAFDF